jgi:hypothetical protein
MIAKWLMIAGVLLLFIGAALPHAHNQSVQAPGKVC